MKKAFLSIFNLRVIAAMLALSLLLALAQRRSEALRTPQMEAQTAALNAQIEPHFLFNTLATTRRLYATTPDRGATCWAA